MKQLQYIGDQFDYITRHAATVTEKAMSWRDFSGSQLSITNEAPCQVKGPELLHQLLEKHAYNSACAVEFRRPDGGLQRFSYDDLHCKSAQFAKRIRALFQESGLINHSKPKIVPLLVPQCAELYIAILAILKAGAAFCPLHLDAPTERIKFITEDVAAQIIVTTSSLRDQIAWENPPRVLLVDDILEDYDGLSSGDEVFSQETCEPEDLAYVMYTSGSTGFPKAVAISHLAASQSLLAHDKHIPTFHRFLQFAAPTFDVFVFEMFFPLYRGKTLVGCDRAELLSDLPAIIKSLDIDAAELTPTVVGDLIQRRSNVPCLKVLLTIGEMLTRPIITEFGGSSLKEGILHGMYGPTEAAIHCTLATQFSSRSKPGIIGVPLDTVSCLVVAPQTQGNDVSQDIDILPAGQIGELAIGGMQLADGYINRLEQTSSVFVDTKLLGRIYRTGDKARLLPDGVLECLGRINTGQVKLRGQRIELGEIEQVAYGINGIISANAMIIGGIIVLFCVTKDEEITSDTVLRSCRRWLPGFVVPGDVSILHDVPRLPSGKVDKSKLKADYEESRINPVFTQGCTLSDTEQRISRITQELLNLNIHVSAHLTAAGLDSLKAIRLASMLRSVGITVGAVDILKANSIQAIAEVWHTKSTDTLQFTETLSSDWKLIRDEVFCELKRLLSTSESGHIQDIIPCTPLQIAMLSETAIHNESYCNWIELECSSSLNFETIQAAFFNIIDQNEILRTGFIQSSNAAHPFVQVIWKCLPESQISQVSSIKHDFQLNSTSDTLRPLRVQISYLEQKATIVVQIHHGIYDGWSWEHIVGDLDLLLRNRDIISRPQFRELVALYQQPAAPARSAISLTYWQNLLQGAPSCRLPNSHGRTDIKSGLQIARATIVTQLYQVESVARKLGVSLQSIFQAAFAWLISMYLGSSDIIFGTVSSGRTLPVTGIEDLLGPCITTLPTRVDVEHSRTTHDLIQAIHRLNRQMLEHHEIPLREINRLCGIESGKALFDSILIWQQTLQDRKPKALSQVNAKDHLEFNLSLEIEPYENVFNVKANYQRSILPEPQTHLLIRQLDQLITAFVRDEPTLLVEINSYLDEEILSLQNPEFENYSIPESLSTPVEIFANEKPTAIALEFVQGINGSLVEKEQISYRRLNERANQLAHYLVEKKVCPDELVCICMEKSVELYVGILGIIKSGAGYLPVSPDTPSKRRNEILSRSKAKICICSSSLLEQNTELRMNTGNHDYEGMNFTPKYSDSSLRQPNIESFPALVTPIYIDQIDLSHMPTSNFASTAQPSHLAYAVFTSGTTGSPKGVLVTRRNILSNLVALSKIYPASEGSKLLQSCSQAFDGEQCMP